MPRKQFRVLVVYKKSAYQLYVVERRNPRLARLAGSRDLRELREAHAIHQATLGAVTAALLRARVTHTLVYRVNLRAAARYDLVVSVGGDGTFFHAAHVVDRTPMLGVNSDPGRSEAVFCAATRETFAELFSRVRAGRAPLVTLARLQVRVNGAPWLPLVVNDVLVAHDDPATMSRYRLRVGPHQEAHKSSGVWIATAAGSSSAIAAAGGRRLAWRSTRFQYRPRELYEGRLSRYRLTGGVLSARGRVEIHWLMRRGLACIDGPHVRVPLQYGDRLTIQPATAHPLRVYGVRSG
ncbi:MAG: NAD(+)/NADH kinase [Candidatus Omnitrophica bacterium]|nr:NAD(+)/NADH kinase [Candidatus Omnitrophota bacterium]